MVVIHVKRSDKDEFLYETTCATSNDTLIRELVEVWNLRLRLAQLAGSIQEMGKYGPMKKPEEAGLDEVKEQGGETVEKGEYYSPDPTGIRTGKS